ncbi:glutamine-hydrolyzing GMP synthase [Candidatus Micrarchaeota archaeon]|nr:glutamine-hydrolyzing GMP synthase [Candidatus Micrarchaeota archaeon]
MIVVMDLGGQYCHLIARKIRELGVKSEIIPFNTSIEKIKRMNPKGIILSGGPNDVNAPDALFPDKGIFSLGIPVLGICYGHQAIAKMLGGRVISGDFKEYGKKIISIKKNPLFKGLKKKEQGWLSHGDTVKVLPKGFKSIASTERCNVAAFASKNNKFFGLQFHPEVRHTPKGKIVLKNFVFSVCRAKKEWSIKKLKNILINEARETIGNKKVLMAVSGGVDSLVSSTILKKAIGDNFFCVFIDTGLMRKNEAAYVKDLYKKLKFKNFFALNAEERFMRRLKGVTDPERKRKIIATTFIRVFEEKARDLEKTHGRIEFLAQGTIYPDRIESAQPSNSANRIKSHHNVTLPEKMDLTVFEPIKELYKDEVRQLGLSLGITKKFLFRHPFPGPGLAIRIIGEVTKEKVRILQEVDSIFIEELEKSNYYDKTWQALAALLSLRSVGVMGDFRTYGYIVSLRAVDSVDAMTADWAKLPHSLLERISTRIVNEVKGVNRVLYDITQKPPATIEYE